MGRSRTVVSFSPRSLVGMSETRKRRLFGREIDALPQHRRAANLMSLFRKYRIGQRLRPCPGCLECEPKDCDGCGFSLGSGEDCEVCDAHAVDRYVTGCDGSGVLPAKRSAAASREWVLELPPVDPPGCYLCGGEGWLPAFTCTAEGFRTLAEQPCPECSQAKRSAGGGR